MMSSARTMRTAVFAGIIGLGLVQTQGSLAQDLRIATDKLRREQTPAYIENLKRWDDTSRFNAEPVADHDREAFKADGIRFGSFMFYPSIDNRLTYNDNIFRTRNGRESDVSYEIMPELKIVSRLPRHDLQIEAGAKAAQHARYKDLDTFDVFAKFHGALHINHAHVLYGSYEFADEHEEVLAVGEPVGARERTPVSRQYASLALRRDAGRLHAVAEVDFLSLDYSDVRARDGTLLDQDRRDTREAAAEVRVGYRFSPGFELQSKVRATRVDQQISGGIDPDGNRYDVLAGVNMETGPLLRWQFAGGYSFRAYDQADLEMTSAHIAETNLTWLAHQNLTVGLSAQRRFRDAVGSNGERGTLENILKAKFDFELRRNLVFTVSGEYRIAEYVGSNRVDDLFISGARLQYFHTKNWYAELGYDFVRRDSTDAEREFTQNTFWGSVKLSF